jgi:hypothetical protein
VKFSQGLVRSSIPTQNASFDRELGLIADAGHLKRNIAASTTAQRRSIRTGSARLVVCFYLKADITLCRPTNYRCRIYTRHKPVVDL